MNAMTDYAASFKVSQVAIKVVDASLDMVDGALTRVGSDKKVRRSFMEKETRKSESDETEQEGESSNSTDEMSKIISTTVESTIIKITPMEIPVVVENPTTVGSVEKFRRSFEKTEFGKSETED